MVSMCLFCVSYFVIYTECQLHSQSHGSLMFSVTQHNKSITIQIPYKYIIILDERDVKVNWDKIK